METHNFADRIGEIRNEMFKAFRDLIIEKGTNDVLDVKRFNEDTILDNREIDKIEYSESCRDILFYLSNDEDIEDYTFFSDYDTLKLAWYYDDIVALLKMEEKNK